LSFTILVAVRLFFAFPILLGALAYLVAFESCVVLEWEIFSFDGLSFSFPVLFDKVGLLFSCVVVVISFRVMLFRVSYMSGDADLEYFIYIVMLFVLSMNFLIYIPHLLFLLLGWDGLGLTSYLLVIYYQNDKSLGAGMITAMSNRVGDSLLILSSCWCFVSGVWVVGFSWFNFLFFSGFCIFVGAITKSAQVPFSAWLPAAIAAPTPVSSLVHSSTLVTAGVYLVVRFYPSLSVHDYFFYFVFYFGVITCLMARFSALYENDLKKVVALSTLRQLGVMFMALGLGFPMLAFFHLITHALFKALLFVCAGTVIHSMQNNQDIRLIGGMWVSMPVTCTSLNVANLALCGFPFMAGFYSKDLIIESFIYSSFPVSTRFLILFSVCLTGGYRIRLSVFTLWSPYKGGSIVVAGDERVVTYFSFFILLVGAVVGGRAFS
jgi:NADH-ubiquinone oxidoreductase chain 5